MIKLSTLIIPIGAASQAFGTGQVVTLSVQMFGNPFASNYHALKLSRKCQAFADA